jgi:plasmid replication initiation protein
MQKDEDMLWKIESVKDIQCLQPNQISQGLYKCSPMAKRLLVYTISNLKMIKWNQEKEPNYEVYFKPVQFAKALGLQRIGTKQQQLIKDALKELQSSFIAIDTGDVFQTFGWVSRTYYAPKDKLINIALNQDLGKALIEYQKGFTTIQLVEMGKLQSFYAMRYYEIACSWKGKKGLGGNRRNEWFFEMTVQGLRDLFQIKDEEYAGRMNNFTKYVVEKPIAEINEKTNLLIKFEKIKDGKTVVGFHFMCSEKAEQIKIEKTDSYEKKQEKIAINKESAEIELYKAKYPNEFAEIYEDEKKQENLFGISLLAEANTVLKLKEMEKAQEL